MKKLALALFTIMALAVASCSKDTVENHNFVTIGDETHPLVGMIFEAQDVYAYDADDTCGHFHIFGSFAKGLVGHSVNLTCEGCQYNFDLGLNANSSEFAISTYYFGTNDFRSNFTSGQLEASVKDGLLIIRAEGVLASGQKVVIDIAQPEQDILVAE